MNKQPNSRKPERWSYWGMVLLLQLVTFGTVWLALTQGFTLFSGNRPPPRTTSSAPPSQARLRSPVPITPLPTPTRYVLALRVFPSRLYPPEAVEVSEAVLVEARTGDSRWAKIKWGAQVGWTEWSTLPESLIIRYAAVALPTESVVAPGKTLAAACINIVGDSVAAGEMPVQIPGVDYWRVSMHPVSIYLRQALDRKGFTDLSVVDRSVAATGLSGGNREFYYNAWAFKPLLEDNCRWIIVLPWINDLNSGITPQQAAAFHVVSFTEFVRLLLNANPHRQIVILNYYPGKPQPFSSGYASGFTPEAVAAFNAALQQACTVGSLRLAQITCLNSAEAFAQMGDMYLAGPMTRAELESHLVGTPSPSEKNKLDYFQRTNPTGKIVGDGVHLSPAGRKALADYLVDALSQLPPLPQ